MKPKRRSAHFVPYSSKSIRLSVFPEGVSVSSSLTAEGVYPFPGTVVVENRGTVRPQAQLKGSRSAGTEAITSLTSTVHLSAFWPERDFPAFEAALQRCG
jgi:hypothetical protein